MGYDVQMIKIPAGELSKDLKHWHLIIKTALDMKCDKYSTFIAVGGGVVMNLTGFVASCIYRGLRLVHIPTTVMGK